MNAFVRMNTSLPSYKPYSTRGHQKWRENAIHQPLTGPYQEFGRAIRALFGHTDNDREYLSSRAARECTGVNHDTLTNALRGERVSASSIIKIAQAFGEDPGPLLLMAGHAQQLAQPVFAPLLFALAERGQLDNPNAEIIAAIASFIRTCG